MYKITNLFCYYVHGAAQRELPSAPDRPQYASNVSGNEMQTVKTFLIVHYKQSTASLSVSKQFYESIKIHEFGPAKVVWRGQHEIEVEYHMCKCSETKLAASRHYNRVRTMRSSL